MVTGWLIFLTHSVLVSFYLVRFMEHLKTVRLLAIT